MVRVLLFVHILCFVRFESVNLHFESAADQRRLAMEGLSVKTDKSSV
jgi:hypothetical protein